GFGGAPTGGFGGTPTGGFGGTPTGGFGGTPTGDFGGTPTGDFGGTPTGDFGGTPTCGFNGVRTGGLGGLPCEKLELRLSPPNFCFSSFACASAQSARERGETNPRCLFSISTSSSTVRMSVPLTPAFKPDVSSNPSIFYVLFRREHHGINTFI
ncbi:hypothetical protein, partial [Pseudomonas endophytica]|uniref:hypothetical protein n=1 Tax=Pseudomonas endophytica TaxID=1563157 RepID=UPI0019D3F87B